MDWRELTKYWLLIQLPIYSGILWVFLFWMSYWEAVILTNTAYTVLMYPILKKGVFTLGSKK